jgi:hypothetical protein
LKRYIFISILLLSSFLGADEEYHFGQGYKLGSTALYLGGYFSSRYDIDNHKEDEFDFDEVAMLLYGNFEKFDFLSEFEADDVGVDKENSNDFDLTNRSVHIERLFVDITLKDDNLLYIGKFNTDIGFWNQTPINVLHDTTTQPHIMSTLFPKLTTGIGYVHSIDDDKTISISLQHNNDLDDEYNNLFVKEHYSFSYKDIKDDFTWGVGGGYFKERNSHQSTYATLGIAKELTNWSILSEFYTRSTEDSASVPYDIYLQGTWHIRAKHDLVIRAEAYDDEIEDSSDEVGLIGYVYRPYPFMALKGEYEAHSIDKLSHFVLSFSVIF